jgi:hypothetical protein
MATKTQRARKMQRRRWHNRHQGPSVQSARATFYDLLTGETKTQLAARASGLDIRGRSKMTVPQLINAILDRS